MRTEEELYFKVMFVSKESACAKCKHFKIHDDGGTVCLIKFPPFYRGDYRIRNPDKDSCNNWEQI
jgi:hypothetical protein